MICLGIHVSIGKYTKVPGSYHLHPGRLTWNLKMICLEDDFPFQKGVIVRFQPFIFRGCRGCFHEWCFLLTFLGPLPRGMEACGWILPSFVWNLLSSTWHRTAVGWKPGRKGSWPIQWLMTQLSSDDFWVKVTDIKKGWGLITSSLFWQSGKKWHFLSCFFPYKY